MTGKNSTYSLEQLKDIIPSADLEQIKSISLIIKEETRYYKSKDINDVLILITRRLIELSNDIRV